MNASVIGAGSWGTALAMQLARAGNAVRLWDHRPERAVAMQRDRENTRYLPGLRFPDGITVFADMTEALDGAELIVEVIPSQSVRAVMTTARPHIPDGALICCASKGIEQNSLMTMEEVLRDVLPEETHTRLSFLAGPSFAKEVAAGQPTGVVVAGRDEAVSQQVAQAFHAGYFRVYHTDDIIGAELGGALKNIIAIACGAADGMGMGLNTRAMIMTRGLAEITRLAVARGANPLTLAGLAGMGDLVLTCTGNLSRNRRVGLGLGQGKPLEQILEELGQVAEGVMTSRSANALADATGVDMPIVREVYKMLYENKSVQATVEDLFHRSRKAERRS
ncbi:MAG: NAD(P)H-dependent glycerol-3-phosphate dehydrogenase [Myxococcota bacterium]